MRVPYPRTPHLPWSPGASADDVRADSVSGLRGCDVVVTEKLDGENTTLYRDGLHARSPDSGHHPSRTWVKALQGRIGAGIPAGWRICGENMFARHSLAYRDLDAWFYGFSVWDDRDTCLGWDETERFLRRLGVPVPPVLWRGVLDERALRALTVDTERQEGYVVRPAGAFARADFARRVAKWVRPRHVTTDTHWMHTAVVENGLGPAAALWTVRSGGATDLPALLAAAGHAPGAGDAPGGPDRAAIAAVVDVSARLDTLGRTGDARLAGVLAAALHGTRREALAPRLAAPLGTPAARRIADLVGLHPRLHRPYPYDDRRAGLVRLSAAADLGVLHAVAAAVLPGRTGAEADEARVQVEWSALHAEDAGLLTTGPDTGTAHPLARLRGGLREALAGLPPAAAERCWAEAREAYALGRIGGTEEAVAATWRWRSGTFPQLVQLTGPAGSGKSRLAARLPGVHTRISLDELREARGARADQRANGDVLREGLDRLDRALTAGAVVVWDATSLNRHQRSLVLAVARRRDALVTQTVPLVDPDELTRRNAVRPHPVPAAVLADQLRRFTPPYPGEAHRTWYVGASGTVDDTAGTLDAEDP
jgi:predicted kinase